MNRGFRDQLVTVQTVYSLYCSPNSMILECTVEVTAKVSGVNWLSVDRRH